MSYGISLTRDDGSLLTFDETFEGLRIVRIVEHSEPAMVPEYILREDFDDPQHATGNFFVSPPPSVPVADLQNPHLFRRLLGFTEGGAAGTNEGRYGTAHYKYLVCDRSVSDLTGYGTVIKDGAGGIVFNSNDEYVQIYSVQQLPSHPANEWGLPRKPAPPAGMYSYISTLPVGTYAGHQLININPDGGVLRYRKAYLAIDDTLIGRYTHGRWPSGSSESRSPLIFDTLSDLSSFRGYGEIKPDEYEAGYPGPMSIAFAMYPE